MVNAFRKALAGFILMPGKPLEPVPEDPCLSTAVLFRASALRGFSDKNAAGRFLVLPGHEESDILRHLRAVVVEHEAPPFKLRYPDGMNLVVFRGVFGSGGYGLDVRAVRFEGTTLRVECDFENPGDGIRTTAGFTQPAVMVPLKRLPEGTYRARVLVRQLCRSSQGVHEMAPSREWAALKFKVCA